MLGLNPSIVRIKKENKMHWREATCSYIIKTEKIKVKALTYIYHTRLIKLLSGVIGRACSDRGMKNKDVISITYRALACVCQYCFTHIVFAKFSNNIVL